MNLESSSQQSLPGIFAWRRVRSVLIACAPLILLMMPGWKVSYAVLIFRWLYIGALCLLAFGVFERWPRKPPRWIARWVLQVIAVAVVVPIATWTAYFITTQADPVPFWKDSDRMIGFATFTILSLLIAPWMAVSALIGQISGKAQRQALAFELERSELEREATQARLRLLQAQVEPHFLFNTLANVRELVESGSAQASAVLNSLIAYLRAAVPRLHEPATTMKQEIELVRAYLEVMHMRMPDRLQYMLQVENSSLTLHCPPMALLTLVENAVRHGIDPSEAGGRIEVRVTEENGQCRCQVIDTGVGMQDSFDNIGTGLANLRERMRLMFGDAARLRLNPLVPQGVSAELEFPARRGVP
ncbi:sensor histidine kinase [Dokdonella sp.]|uniref:sensor histidine kinase n=1 Tax=Dokdonella sp. TaxID=2291710 RepID=UPI0035290C53